MQATSARKSEALSAGSQATRAVNLQGTVGLGFHRPFALCGSSREAFRCDRGFSAWTGARRTVIRNLRIFATPRVQLVARAFAPPIIHAFCGPKL